MFVAFSWTGETWKEHCVFLMGTMEENHKARLPALIISACDSHLLSVKWRSLPAIWRNMRWLSCRDHSRLLVPSASAQKAAAADRCQSKVSTEMWLPHFVWVWYQWLRIHIDIYTLYFDLFTCKGSTDPHLKIYIPSFRSWVLLKEVILNWLTI